MEFRDGFDELKLPVQPEQVREIFSTMQEPPSTPQQGGTAAAATIFRFPAAVFDVEVETEAEDEVGAIVTMAF